MVLQDKSDLNRLKVDYNRHLNSLVTNSHWHASDRRSHSPKPEQSTMLHTMNIRKSIRILTSV
jgi:hypothetical protein